MRPIDFPESNTIYAEDQPEYLPLPAYVSNGCTVSLWGLTWRERLKILVTGRLWLSQLNFDEPLQPQRPEVDNPISPSFNFWLLPL